MAVRDDFAPGEVLTAADLNDTLAAKANTVSPTFTGTVALPLTTTAGGVDAFSAWGTWTPSYTGSRRGKYAGVGDRYDAETDTFVSPVIDAPAE